MPKYTLSEQDKALFRESMRTVKPLKKNNKIVASKTPTQSISIRKTKQDTVSMDSLYLSDYCSDPVQAESILSYCTKGIPRNRFKQLRNGEIHYQARLDLHGMHTENAREALCHFILTQCEQANRCLLIIHGKGGYDGEPPIIKNFINIWLRQIPQVLAFHSAKDRDGGRGAVYVLLKRTR